VAARDRTGASVADLTRAYAAVRDSFSLQDLHAEIDRLDATVPGGVQLELYAIVQDVLVDRLCWFTHNLPASGGLDELVMRYRKALAELAAIVPSLLPREQLNAVREVRQRLKGSGVPDALVERLAMLPTLAQSANVIVIAERAGRSLAEAARTFFAVSERFGFGRIEAMTEEVATGDYYESLALQKARDSLEGAHRELAQKVIANGGDSDRATWEHVAGERISATAEQVAKLVSDRRPSMAKVAIAASLLSELARS
jgi:glutamate dehydrogenase